MVIIVLYIRSKLRSVFPLQNFAGGLCLNSTGFSLLADLLHMDPAQRISAADACAHLWFMEHPLPKPIEHMPTFAD